MTKKEFKKLISFHKYGNRRDSSIIAIFFDYNQGELENGDYFRGYKFCLFSRSTNATKAELINIAYDAIINEVETPYYIQQITAQNDSQRFRVPIVSSGLNKLIKYEPVTN